MPIPVGVDFRSLELTLRAARVRQPESSPGAAGVDVVDVAAAADRVIQRTTEVDSSRFPLEDTATSSCPPEPSGGPLVKSKPAVL